MGRSVKAIYLSIFRFSEKKCIRSSKNVLKYWEVDYKRHSLHYQMNQDQIIISYQWSITVSLVGDYCLFYFILKPFWWPEQPWNEWKTTITIKTARKKDILNKRMQFDVQNCVQSLDAIHDPKVCSSPYEYQLVRWLS